MGAAAEGCFWHQNVAMDESELPAIYQATDRASLRGQRQSLLALRVRIGGLVAAAIGGAFVWKVKEFDAWGAVAAVGFLVAVLAGWYAVQTKPDRTWYEGRAAAESAKTLAWRYMVGGLPFGFGAGSAEDMDTLFVGKVRSVFKDLDGLDLSPDPDAAHQITPTMRANRGLGLGERRALYDRDRIEDQRAWYANKASSNVRMARWFEGIALALEGVGILLASLKAFRVVSLDLLGVVAAVGGGVAAWSQAKQYRSITAAYSIAAQELAAIRDVIHIERDETDWAAFVDDCEEAISREHTLWRASRGVA